MEHMSDDARTLIRAAQEVHAERHGAQTFLPGTYPYPEPTYPFRRRRNAPASARTASATTML
jgi:hypothetical protein